MSEMENKLDNSSAYFDEPDEDNGLIFTEYDLTSSPNDYNVKTLFDFISSGIVQIPAFQRNYVWDIKRASKLIESIIIGIPIPQIFLYELQRNKFIVIDGQQRYMTIYYFMKKRFPKKDKRSMLRKFFAEHNGIPEKIIHDSEYFEDFNLKLVEKLPNHPNQLNGKNYSTLDEELKIVFDMRTIRSIIIKENSATSNNDNGAVFEIFNRLNSGGVNLKPQEIRTSLFHSDFYNLLNEININDNWRKITPQVIPDLHMKDIEFILRAFAMLINRDNYRPSMTRFLNQFSYDARSFDKDKLEYLKQLFFTFIDQACKVEKSLFYTKKNQFNVSIFESIFYSSCIEAYKNNTLNIKFPLVDRINELRDNSDFTNAVMSSTASAKNVNKRLDLAMEILYLNEE